MNCESILKTLIDKKFIIDPDETVRVDYVNQIKVDKKANKYNL